MLFTLAFWKATLERSLGTAGEVFLALYGTDTLGWLSVNHLLTLEITGMAFVLAAVKCITVAAISDGTPSFGNIEQFNVPAKPPVSGKPPVDQVQ